MRINIISAGPSVVETWDRNTSYKIAVNSGLAHVESDCFVAGDRITFIRMEEKLAFPTDECWTVDGEVNNVKAMSAWSHYLVNSFQGLPGIVQLPSVCESLGIQKRTWNWSFQGACAVAAHKGASMLHVYGVDLCGTDDIAGYGGEYRCDERWNRERTDTAITMEWLRRAGIKVIQHTKTGELDMIQAFRRPA